jgi:hypothetical protein
MAEELDDGAAANTLLQVAQMYEEIACEQPNERVAQTAELKLGHRTSLAGSNPISGNAIHHRLGRQFGQRNFGSATR